MQISRRINHTGRQKLERDEVIISLVNPDKIPFSFNAEFRLTEKKLPGDAEIYVEAYRGNTSQRYHFGTVAAPVPPGSTDIDQIDLTGPVLFRVKVVDKSESTHKLLALADRIKPDNGDEDDQKASLMTFRSRPLGQLTWKTIFVDVDKPELCINSNIPQGKDQLLHNPYFQSLILPAAFREILMFIAWDTTEAEPDETSWQKRWLDFAATIAKSEKPSESEAIFNWIDEVAANFSENHMFCDHLLKHMETEDNG